MGPSGCGKTTLLNALSRRGRVTAGEVRYGESGSLWSKKLKRKVALVEQDDCLFPMLTVREQIRYSAALRLPSLSPKEREDRAQALIETLRLDKCAETAVGDSSVVEKRGVSGGERKRLSIALQLLTLPALLFCDEPTSGLDSSITLSVVEALKDLTRITGVTVVCSIHQPSSQVFALFDKLILLNKGEALYQGPTLEAANRFATLGLPCPATFGHAEWLLEALVLERFGEVELDALRAEHGVAAFAPFARHTGAAAASAPDEKLPWLAQVRVLVSRCWKVAKGSLWSYELATLQLVIGLLEGLLFARIGYAEEDAAIRFRACFIIVVKSMFFPMLNALPVIPTSEVLLRKELAVGAYSLSAWFMPATTIPLLPDFINAAVNFVPMYWIAGVADDAGAFFLSTCAIICTIICFQSIGYVFSIVSGRRSGSVTMVFMSFCFLFSGVFAPLDKIALPWIGYLNPLFYATCFVAQSVFLQGTSYEQDDASKPPKTRDEVLNDANLYTPAGVCAAVLLGVAVLVRLLAFLLLQRKMRRVLLVQTAVHDEVPSAPKHAATVTVQAEPSPKLQPGLAGAVSANVEAV
uniref:ABC transporter domain-containing protein n=1 Tax=Coccolithus braarudii TaxID=221442 RepID=A0A7S0Q580_9EUKA